MPRLRDAILPLLLVLLAAIVTLWPGLDGSWSFTPAVTSDRSPGFILSEGHRVAPAYELLERWPRGPHLVPTMFERVYLRKPPGMPWLIALSSSMLGHSVFAARAVSAAAATLLALVTAFFAHHWFAHRPSSNPASASTGPARASPLLSPGLWAGLAVVLMPQLWPYARLAEIEMAHTAATGLASLLIVYLLTTSARHRTPAVILATLTLALTLIAMALLKGPAGFIMPAAALLAGTLRLITRRTPPPGQRRAVILARLLPPLLASALAGLVLLALALLARDELRALLAAGSDRPAAPPITQSPDAFMWDLARWPGIAILPIAAFVAALPASLALLFPWGPDAAREAQPDTPSTDHPPATDHPREIALVLALTWLIAVGAFWLLGVANVRYLQPAAAIPAALAGYVAWGLAGPFLPKRRLIARLFCLGHPVAMLAVLLLGAGAWLFIAEPAQRRHAGAAIAVRLASTIHDAHRPTADAALQANPSPVEVVVTANDAIEARPDILLALRRHGRDVFPQLNIRILWVDNPLDALPDASVHTAHFAIIRTDSGSREAEHAASSTADTWTALLDTPFGRHTVRLLRRDPDADPRHP